MLGVFFLRGGCNGLDEHGDGMGMRLRANSIDVIYQILVVFLCMCKIERYNKKDTYRTGTFSTQRGEDEMECSSPSVDATMRLRLLVETRAGAYI